jgi:hypothetical protein
MGTIPAMPDELTYLPSWDGLHRRRSSSRTTSRACARISTPRTPRTDKRQVSTKIRDAQRVLAARTRSATRDEAAEWLEQVRQAIERLNTAMNASRIVWVGRKHAEDRLGPGEMPRKGRPLFRTAANSRVPERALFRLGERGR